MAKTDGDWTRQHRDVIQRLEQELGREICGVPTPSGLPCKEWPISQQHGRCSKHQPEPERETSPVEDSRRREPTSPESPPTEEEPSSWFSRRVVIPLGLILTGLLLGGGTVAYFYPSLPGRSLLRSSQESPADGVADVQPASATESLNPGLSKIDPRDPNFATLYKAYREDGNSRQLLELLDRIIRQSPDQSDRAEAMYRKFVLLQILNRFERSVRVADRYLNRFKQGSHRPEILYGAGWISETYLNQHKRSRSYYRKLKDEFPKSKWAQTVSSRM